MRDLGYAQLVGFEGFLGDAGASPNLVTTHAVSLWCATWGYAQLVRFGGFLGDAGASPNLVTTRAVSL